MHSFVGNRIITRKIPYRNPLLTFMFFVNCNDFNLSDIQDIYNSNANNKANLPNIICFLDKGVVVNTHHSRAESFHHLHDISLIPEFNIEYQNDPSQWILIPFENLGASWFYLVIMLSGHLRQSVLTQPDLSKYLSNLLTWDRNHIQRM